MQAEIVQTSRPTTVKPKSRLANREARWGWFFIAPWIIGFAIFTVFPVVASLFLSLNQYEMVTAPKWIGFKNYTDLFTVDRLFLVSLANTAYYVAFSVPLSIIVAFTLSMLLNIKLHGMNFFRTVFYLPAVTSGVAVSLLWMWLFNPQFGLINYLLRSIGLSGPGWLVDPVWAKPAYIMMSLWGVGGTVVIFLAGLQGVSRNLYEAAEIDGANT
jgi:multiple sugar transport system permease protein